MIAGAVLGGDVGVITIAAAFFLGPVIAWVRKKVEAYAGFHTRAHIGAEETGQICDES